MRNLTMLNDKFFLFIFLTTPFFYSIFSPDAKADSDAECAIWMCLPMGFPSGCGEAKSEFKKRIKKHKSPLPSFSSCLVGTPNNEENSDRFDAKSGVAALIPPYKYCVREERYQHGKDSGTRCVEWGMTQQEIVKGTYCQYSSKNGYRSPRHCSKTLRFTEVYRNGQLYGETHYY